MRKQLVVLELLLLGGVDSEVVDGDDRIRLVGGRAAVHHSVASHGQSIGVFSVRGAAFKLRACGSLGSMEFSLTAFGATPTHHLLIIFNEVLIHGLHALLECARTTGQNRLLRHGRYLAKAIVQVLAHINRVGLDRGLSRARNSVIICGESGRASILMVIGAVALFTT